MRNRRLVIDKIKHETYFKKSKILLFLIIAGDITDDYEGCELAATLFTCIVNNINEVNIAC